MRGALVTLLAGPAFAVTIVFCPVAHADGSATDRQIAQSLFDDGRALMEAGQYAEACPKFAGSQGLDPAAGTLLNLALCHELENKTATAWTEFREAMSMAMRDEEDRQKSKDRQKIAETHIKALAPRLIRLTIALPAGVAARAPEIVFDQSRVPTAALNTAIPVDPGQHHLSVSGRGLTPWETTVVTTEEGRTYRIDIPSLDSPDGCALGTRRRGDKCEAVVVARPVTRRSTAFWVVLAGAGLSLGTSVVTGFMALDANAYVEDNCSTERDFCRVADAAEAASRARTLAWVSTATMVVGAGAAVFAFVLPLEARSPVTASFGMQNGAATASLRVAGW